MKRVSLLNIQDLNRGDCWLLILDEILMNVISPEIGASYSQSGLRHQDSGLIELMSVEMLMITMDYG